MDTCKYMTSVIHKVKITNLKCKKEIKYRIFKIKVPVCINIILILKKSIVNERLFKAPTNMAMEFTLTMVQGNS